MCTNDEYVREALAQEHAARTEPVGDEMLAKAQRGVERPQSRAELDQRIEKLEAALAAARLVKLCQERRNAAWAELHAAVKSQDTADTAETGKIPEFKVPEAGPVYVDTGMYVLGQQLLFLSTGKAHRDPGAGHDGQVDGRGPRGLGQSLAHFRVAAADRR